MRTRIDPPRNTRREEKVGGVANSAEKMAVETGRMCLLTFRLSDKEYELAKTACMHQGSKSIAEFVRRAVMYQVQREGEGNVSFADDLATLTVRLQELELALKDAGMRIGRLLGTERRNERKDTPNPAAQS
jgi:hypothetical protein